MAGDHLARQGSEPPARSIGALGEQLACAHLERLGLEVLARNVRMQGGEIDLIALGERTLVFVEVKTTRLSGAGAPPACNPLERLDGRQRLRLRRAAVRWLAQTPVRPWARTVRFDAIAVTLDAGGRLAGLEHLEDAF